MNRLPTDPMIGIPKYHIQYFNKLNIQTMRQSQDTFIHYAYFLARIFLE